MERVTSGIPGLDVVLRGGFLRGGIYMIMGRPGCGKTTLGNQLAFHHVEEGGRALYVTLLAESHARMLAHMESFSWFEPARVGAAISYVSAYGELERGRLDGLLEALRLAIRRQEATLLIIDGVPTAEAVAESDLALKKFIHELQVLVELMSCTCLLLTGTNHADAHYPERTMVDGLVTLATTQPGMRTIRELEVVKHRGSPQLTGRHLYEIGPRGVVVHPRLEAVLGTPTSRPEATRDLLRLGIPALDALMGGGLIRGSTTLLKGPPGIGKTHLGLAFLAEGAAQGEPGLHFGFFEGPPRLLQKADRIGLGLRDAVARGEVELIWNPEHEQLADALAHRMLEAVTRNGVRRVVIDGLGAFLEALIYPARAGAFFAALTNELRARAVTTLITAEARDLVGAEVEVPVSGISAMVENVLYLRYVERRSNTHRLISVFKMSEHGFDPSLREFRITEDGISVAETSASAEAILDGVLRTSALVSGQPGPAPGNGHARGKRGEKGEAKGRGRTSKGADRARGGRRGGKG